MTANLRSNTLAAVGPKESYPCMRISVIFSGRSCSVDAHAIIDVLRAEQKELERAIPPLERLEQRYELSGHAAVERGWERKNEGPFRNA
jgi:hypothetical protein